MLANICLDLTWYEDISSRQSVDVLYRGGGFDLAFLNVLHHLVLQHPLKSNRCLYERNDYSFVCRSCYVYVIHPDLSNAVCSEQKTKSNIYWGWWRHQPFKKEIWPELYIDIQLVLRSKHSVSVTKTNHLSDTALLYNKAFPSIYKDTKAAKWLRYEPPHLARKKSAFCSQGAFIFCVWIYFSEWGNSSPHDFFLSLEETSRICLCFALYGAETWTARKTEQKYPKSFEM